MTLIPIDGYPPIKRFIRGHLYYTSPAYVGTVPSPPGAHYMVGVFCGIVDESYKFLKIADHAWGISNNSFYLAKNSSHYVRETCYEDMPLYMNAIYISPPLYKKILSGETRYGRVLSKTKAAREMNFKRKVNLTGKP